MHGRELPIGDQPVQGRATDRQYRRGLSNRQQQPSIIVVFRSHGRRSATRKRDTRQPFPSRLGAAPNDPNEAAQTCQVRFQRTQPGP